MSAVEVPSTPTDEMIRAFLEGFYKNTNNSIDINHYAHNATVRADIRRGYSMMLDASPKPHRPKVNNIPGNPFMRNLRKFRIEGKFMAKEMRPHVDRWLKKPWSAHDFTNMFVEAARLSPYIIGHIDVVVYPLFLLLVVFAVVS